jgi:hypothetical protein
VGSERRCEEAAWTAVLGGAREVAGWTMPVSSVHHMVKSMVPVAVAYEGTLDAGGRKDWRVWVGGNAGVCEGGNFGSLGLQKGQSGECTRRVLVDLSHAGL